MPPKQPNPTRAWGTRYDTLPTSPPVSPEIDRYREQQAFQDINASPEGSTERSDTKLPHDASVFVGSLPASVDQAELTRLLTDHLSEYAEIKSIKVIRDSKGGVCAFVQCADAEAASSFLKSLQTGPPKPFLGRTLRYEPARAFRTLLISYKAPSRLIPPHEIGRLPPRVAGGLLRLELPHAMRIWKPKISKYHRILYNMEAMDAERFSEALVKEGVAHETEDAIYLQPLTFDSETIVKLARYFGPLEQVSTLTGSPELVRVPDDGIINPECYPLPHNSPRSDCMDTACWEIKWEHRDDCVTALMVLRRVPYLSVSWAHNSHTRHGDHRYRFPGYQRTLQYIPRTITSAGCLQTYDSSGAIHLPGSDSVVTDKQLQVVQDIDRDGHIIHKPELGFNTDVIQTWENPIAPSGALKETSDVVGASASLPEAIDHQFNPLLVAGIDWAKRTDSISCTQSDYDPKLDWNTWEDCRQLEKDLSPPSIIASRSPPERFSLQKLEISSRPVPADEVAVPGLAMSPPTPRTTLPRTPVTPSNPAHNGAPFARKLVREHGNDRENDPTTLFVGGLELYGPEAWSLGKLHSVFARFDGLVDVKMVRPPNGSTAFAFVRYNNTKSPTQAILEEHNRVYAGRALKVQLRDINPPRSPWKYGRGRGRTSNHYPPRKLNLTQHTIQDTPKRDDPLVDHNSPDITDVKGEIIETVPLGEFELNGTDSAQDEPVAPDGPQRESPVARVLQNVEGEKYREWYDAPMAEFSPKSSESGGSIAPSLAPPAMPYQIPGFYPMPWIQPYPQPGQYPMPFYGPYPGYPIPPPPLHPPSSDTNSFPAGGLPWHGVIYNAYTPYGPSAPERCSSAPGPAPQLSQFPSVPLAPSGFIQHDHGALIAVYAPDALDQYMSGQNTGSNSSTHSTNTSSTWPQTQTLAGPGPQPTNNPPRPYWSSAHPPFVHMPPSFAGRSTFNSNAGPSASGRSDAGVGVSTAAERKQGYHKDHQSMNRSSRTFNNRNGRGHAHFAANTEGANTHYWNSQAVNGSKWNNHARR
ncbi:hypothetical protein AGABI2DRAFT_113810 [Agaricus bisporus var. bisporus H97]|uniref:hypothetical protein n=1 Tax=Agaricus bisporus var. bisporus (strain H97 / ATCC MYA-4626 / FGSC 10389) TaxID=936046 RepID=UPI00029F5196|nr:hypothetical protein AGABI2DRAFT_113810 [Agaricus bisporus var. bisporus H97]EKV51066.1 hypothetical protein AGABI2DRAFT_113810 [Agaricus bisporus var. bisporus H97]